MAISVQDKYVFLADLHYEHRLWRNELSFYKEELIILQERLNEIVSKNTDPEAVTGVESFQNRFELQRKNISDLKHKIKKHEQYLTEYAENHPIAIDHVHFTDHTAIREEMETFTDLYQEMKRAFNRFAVKWM
jgi:mRNA deadenylase 3'-5' endonuclease subunit Ccr4